MSLKPKREMEFGTVHITDTDRRRIAVESLAAAVLAANKTGDRLSFRKLPPGQTDLGDPTNGPTK